MSRHLIVGLGNPGNEYRDTRHNIGFRVVDRLAERHRIGLEQNQFDGRFGSGRVMAESAMLLEPETMMNRSGESVGACARYYDLEAGQIAVVHDDVDLELGEVRVKTGGSAGGHNGLKDIEDDLGDRGFHRIRCGVGRPEHGSVTDHVLGRFDRDEEPMVERVVELACDAVEILVEEGPSQAQNQIHGASIQA